MNDKMAERRERRENHDNRRLSMQAEMMIRILERGGLSKDQAKEKIKEIVDNV